MLTAKSGPKPPEKVFKGSPPLYTVQCTLTIDCKAVER